MDPSETRPPASVAPLVVFAQRADARADVEAWCAHAVRFFKTRLGLADVARSAQVAPLTNDLRFVVAPEGCPSGIRSACARPRTAADLTRADEAEARAGGGGLAPLARRCATVWLVARESADDALALRLAAILASVLLGPIFDEATGELFGVATARRRLDAS